MFEEVKSIKWIYFQKDFIDFSPACQRHSKLWQKKQKQLLIDSILNGFDIPKFYFQFMPPNVEEQHFNYAIIDGKQRIETVLEFINDVFPLSIDFCFLNDSLNKQFGDISGKYFSEIDTFAPALSARIWQYELSIVFIDTNSQDIINELFVRLNSGVPVNTAEKRHANGGILSSKIQELCDTSLFFNKKIKFVNRRFSHNDLALKLLILETGELDLTKNNVDEFLKSNQDYTPCKESFEQLKSKLSTISAVFEDRDPLLSKKNIIITLYTILPQIPIEALHAFLEYFEDARTNAQESHDEDGNNDSLKEFNRLLQQGADKKSSIQERSRIMMQYFRKYLNEAND